MSEYNTDLAQKHIDSLEGFVAGNVPSVRNGGRLRVATAVWSGVSVAAGDVIRITRIPSGAIVLPELSSVTSEGVGTLQLAVGNETASAAYGASMAVGTAGTYALTKGTDATTAEAGKEPVWVIATASGTPAVTAGKRLKFSIAYVIA